MQWHMPAIAVTQETEEEGSQVEASLGNLEKTRTGDIAQQQSFPGFNPLYPSLKQSQMRSLGRSLVKYYSCPQEKKKLTYRHTEEDHGKMLHSLQQGRLSSRTTLSGKQWEKEFLLCAPRSEEKNFIGGRWSTCHKESCFCLYCL